MSSYITPSYTISSLFSSPYVSGRSLGDLFLAGLLRPFLCLATVLASAAFYKTKKEMWGEMKHSRRGMTKEEKEEAALEEPWPPYLRRLGRRPTVPANLAAVSSLLLASAKCFDRLFSGAGDEVSVLPFWAAVGATAIMSVAELSMLGEACEAAVGR